MSLKCSILGHRYGESDIERSREEDGSEVVTTIREIETCQRCGEQRVVSENKEVTTLETAADIVSEDLGESTADEPSETASDTGDPSPAEQTDASAQEANQTEMDGAESTAQSGPSGAEIQDAETDDAEILDAETSEPAAQPEQSVAPETAPTDAGTDAQPDDTVPDAEDDDGVILGEDSDDDTDEREPGEWPEEDDEGEDDWQPETTPVSEDADIEPTGSAVTVPEGEFYCPECDFTTPVEDSSLREGDFCPECHRGSLKHRTG
ncbi:DUF7093 family protein [Halovenus marina]|uniref:DUF7093 family protein n=1 Tax=Halovenus marina TaxID=3396621 RepID=UPI003F578724